MRDLRKRQVRRPAGLDPLNVCIAEAWRCRGAAKGCAPVWRRRKTATLREGNTLTHCNVLVIGIFLFDWRMEAQVTKMVHHNGALSPSLPKFSS